MSGDDKAFLIFCAGIAVVILLCTFFAAGSPDVLDGIIKMVNK